MRLTRNESMVDGHHCIEVEVGGDVFLVRDDCQTVLGVVAAFEDVGRPVDRFGYLVTSIFVDCKAAMAHPRFPELLAEAAWEACLIDLDGSHKGEAGDERVMDWEQDADRIKASLLMCYGVPWNELVCSYSYRDVVAMVGMVGHDTPMGQALYYRTARPPKPSKGNEADVRRFRELRDFYRLDGSGAGSRDRFAGMSGQAADAFASFGRAAKG